VVVEHSNFLTPNDVPSAVFKHALGLGERIKWREKAPMDFNVETDAGPMKAVYDDQLTTDGPVPWIHKVVSCRRPDRKGFHHEILDVQVYRLENVTPSMPSGVRVRIQFVAGGPRQGSLLWVDLNEIRDWR
jgi:hypothetical protein